MAAVDPIGTVSLHPGRPPTHATIDNIQVLRAVAASLVVLFHVQRSAGDLSGIRYDLDFAAWGVDVFFVISGFIMFHTTMGFRRSAREFITDRAVRVVPLYWIATLALYSLYLIGFRPNGLHEASPFDVLSSLAFIPRHLPHGGPVLLSLGWTLIYEMMFYLLFAATFVLRSHLRSLLVLGAVFAALGCVRLAFADLPYTLGYFTNTIMFEFLLGAALALMVDRLPTRPSHTAIIAAVSLIILGIAAIVDLPVHNLAEGFGAEARWLRAGVPALALVTGAIVLDRVGFALRWPPLLLLGAASYALYLFHPFALQPAMKFLAKVPHPAGAAMAVIANLFALGLCCILAVAVHLFVERPMTRALRRLRAFGRIPAAALAEPARQGADEGAIADVVLVASPVVGAAADLR